jgi:hypothetical protein
MNIGASTVGSDHILYIRGAQLFRKQLISLVVEFTNIGAFFVTLLLWLVHLV